MRRLTMLLTLALLMLNSAAAEPLKQISDLEDLIRIDLNNGKEYIYSFHYPQVEAADEAAELINSFYQYKADDARNFEIPMNADYYRSQNLTENISTEISYSVKCNNDLFFSVLVCTRQGGLSTYSGHTFARSELKEGTTISLPYLLGLLKNGTNDEWLQERQTERANAAVRELVWERLQAKDDITLRPELTESELEYVFFPEEDFYLDHQGNPVFYFQPGIADETALPMLFPVTVDEILDEM